VRHWTNSWWYIWVLHCLHFLVGDFFLSSIHHTEVAVCEVICWVPPYHGHCRQHGTSIAIHPSAQLWWTGHAAHVWSLAVLVGCFTTKVHEVGSFYHWD
jgi:hypothetical protein